MSGLEDRLVALGAGLTFPHEDSLADDVVAAIGAARPVRWRRPLAAAAAVVLVVAGLVAAIPGSRRAVARWLGFESLRIEVVEDLPAPAPASLPVARTLDEAAAIVGVRPLVAPVLGDPIGVEAPSGRSVVVRYGEALVQTIPGRLDEGQFVKLASRGATVMPVTVDGAAAYWITGAPHVVVYEDADGVLRDVRSALDTLVWVRGDVVVRVEGELTLTRALEIARSLREP